jgi:hypothetical protein
MLGVAAFPSRVQPFFRKCSDHQAAYSQATASVVLT